MSDAAAVTNDLDYYVVQYIMKLQGHRVRDIEQEFGVTVASAHRVCDEIVTVEFRRYNPTIRPDNEDRARRAFLALYEAVYQRIVQRTVRALVRPPMTANDLLSIINKEYVFVSTDPDGVFTLVGPFEDVSTVENFILKQNAMGHPQAGDDRGRFRQDDEEGGFPPEIGNAEGRSPEPVSVFEVGGLAVKVYSADITRLPVDVIVNAANEHLQNYAGVAGAIERAGGDELRQDCEAIVEQGGPLRVCDELNRTNNVIIIALIIFCSAGLLTLPDP